MKITSDFLKMLGKQPGQEDFLPPFRHHIHKNIVSLRGNRLCFVLRLEGTPFEGVSDRTLVNQYLSLNQALTSFGKDKGSRLGLWCTLHHKKVDFNRNFHFKTAFTRQFYDKYIEKLKRDNYFENAFYITAVLKYEDKEYAEAEALELMDKMCEMLDIYQPVPLGAYQNSQGIWFSDVYGFIGSLINGRSEPIPLSTLDAFRVIPSADLHFGAELLEMRSSDKTRFATLYDLKEFGQSKINVLKDILSLPCEFIFTQSFTFITPAKMQKKIDDQLNKLESVDDRAKAQHKELDEAKGHIAAGNIMFGDHHGALVVFSEIEERDGNDFRKAYKKAAERASTNGQMVTARFLNSGGFRWLRASLSAPATFYSQVPGSKLKPRPFPKATTSLACSFGMHTHNQGKSWGNPLGDGSAVMPLKTVADTLYNFNFHFTHLNEFVPSDEYPAGHTLFLGKTGTGKTTLLAALLSFAERFDPYLFAMDLDKGMEIFIRAIGGSYFSLEANRPTGINPFQWPDTSALRDFLYELVGTCVRMEGRDNTPEEQEQIKMAVNTVMNLDFQHRRFGALMHSIPPSLEENSLRTRLEAWCGNGRFAWCLDNPENLFNPEAFYRIGFDVTDLLKDGYRPTEPVLACLFFMQDMMLTKIKEEKKVLFSVVEEFWRPLQYETTREYIKKGLKTGRKLGQVMLLVSQSPKDAINSPLFDTIVEQTVTKVLLPNPAAEYEGSYERCGLTKKEYQDLIKLGERSRTFMVKQNLHVSLAKLNLRGFEEEIAVLSGNSANVHVMYEAMDECGSDHPDDWLPVFHRKRKEYKQANEQQQRETEEAV